MKKKNLLQRSLVPACAAALALLSSRSSAANLDVWTGGASPDGNWTTANNWGGVAPLALDSLLFDGSTQVLATNNFAAGTVFSGLNFSGGASSFTLAGNSVTLATPTTANYAIGLNAVYMDGSISNISPNPQTINVPLVLTNGHHLIIGNAGGSTLSLAGPVTLTGAASASFSDGINVTGSGLANVNGILGGWATMQPPASWASLDGSGNVVGYSAFTDVAAGGAIASAASSNVRVTTSGANVTLAAAVTTDINSLFFPDTGGAEIVDVAAGKILRLGAKGGIFNASRQLGSSRVETIGTGVNIGYVTAGGADNTPGDLYLIETPLIGNTGNQLVMNSRITNNGTAAVTVHIFGHISFLSVVHTYTGGTYIHGGRLSASGNTTLGFGPVFVYPGGQLFLNSSGTYTNAMFIAGLGNGESGGNGAIRMGGRTISGTVTLMGDAATGNGTLSGKITGPGGLLVGAGSGNGVGTLTVGSSAGANDYIGDTTINASNSTAASTLQIATGRNNIMPHGAGKGNLFFNGNAVTPSVATFDLNATAQTINGLNSTGTVARAVITSSTAGAATLTAGDGDTAGNYGGTIQNGIGFVGLTKIGTNTLTLTGLTPYTGNTTVTGGRLVFAGSTSISGSTNVIINSNAILNVAAICPVTFAGAKNMFSSNGITVLALQGVGSAITVSNLTSLGATNFITIALIPGISTYPAQFPAIKYTSLNGTLNFGLAGSLPVSPSVPYGGYVSNNIANGSVDFVVTNGPISVKWAGNDGTANNSAWDTSTTNWRLGGGGLTTYADGEFANFDDTAVNSLVTLNVDVAPAGITVSNSVLTYTNNGGGKITGNSGLTKLGNAALLLDNSGINDFSGGVAISAGTIQVGDNDTGGNLPASGIVVNNGALVYKHTDTLTESSLISGSGTLTQNGNGTLDLTGANTYTGAVTVVKGTLQVDNNTALGTTNGTTTIANGATLAIVNNAINLGQERIIVSGSGVNNNGALVNNSGSTTFVGPNMARVTMVGDTTVGGSGRFDLRSATTGDSSLSSLSTGGQPYKLTKVGPVAFGLIGCTVDPQLGNIDVQQGIFSIEAATTSIGNPANTLSVFPGATFQMFAATNLLNKQFILGGDGTSTFTISATSGAGNTIIGPMNITNDCNFSVNNAAVALMLSNNITGPGKITKVGLGLLTIAGNSTNYTGGILQSAGNVTLSGTLTNTLGVTVNQGKFVLNGTLLGGGLTNANGSTVAGTGVSVGPADIVGFLNPGDTNVFGTLTFGGLNLENGASLNYDLSTRTTPGGGTNDLIVVNGDLVINGNSITINPVGLLKTGSGNPYRLFNYTGNLVWNSDLYVNSAVNYTFTVDTNTPGQVNVILGGGPPVWNGGSSTDNNWTDSANWGGVTINPGNTLFFDKTTRLNNTNDEPADTTFSDISFNTDAGSFILNGNQVNLAGNLVNFSTNVQTIKFGMDFSTSRTFNGGTGTASLIIGGGLTNTASTTVTLAGNGILTNLIGCSDATQFTNVFSVASNANWTLLDNPSSIPINTAVQLDMLGGTFTFGGPGSAPVLTSTIQNGNGNNFRLGNTVGVPATFNMVNGTLYLPNARLNTGLGANCIAQINQTGGTLSVGLMQSSDTSANALTMMNLTGGTFTVTNGGTFFLASRGTGIVTVASSSIVNCGTLDMSRNAAGNTSGSQGTVNLNAGGTINCSHVGTASGSSQLGPPTAGPAPTATFNFNGGTLVASASSTTFFQGNVNSSAAIIPITAIVKSGGAIIDSGSNAISVLEPLQHDATLGGTQDGGLLKRGTGTLTLTAVSTYTGNTTVSNGTLVVNGTLGVTAVTVATNATLSGTGSMGSNVTVNVGGTVAPGTVGTLGILTVVSNVTLSGTASMDINATTLTNDVLKAGGITYGGTLTVTNISGSPAAGNSFKLFTASSITGSFTATNLPALGAGLGWNWNPATAILSVIQTVNTAPTNITTVVSGNTLTLSWPADHTGWRLQVQTNSLGSGLNPATNAWFTVPGSTSVNSVNATLDSANGTVFYRMVYP